MANKTFFTYDEQIEKLEKEKQLVISDPEFAKTTLQKLGSIREFEKITREYEASVNPNVSAITIHPDLFSRLGILKNTDLKK